MAARIVCSDEEATQSLIEVRERKRRRSSCFAFRKMARKFRQEFGVHGAKNPFDLAPPLRARDRREDKLYPDAGW